VLTPKRTAEFELSGPEKLRNEFLYGSKEGTKPRFTTLRGVLFGGRSEGWEGVVFCLLFFVFVVKKD